jgi:cysteinyl-tRNA synthetase
VPCRPCALHDGLRRGLPLAQDAGYEVTYVRNITDIDDKIIKRALERNIAIRELTEEMTEAMHQDVAALGILPPTHEPRATNYVPQMLDMIETLEGKGLAYRRRTAM